jgi:zinc transporter ZupT
LTLPELLGATFAVLGSLLAPIAAWFLGYGFVGALLAVIPGFLGGWMIGVALTGAVVRFQEWGARARHSMRE